MSFEKIFNGFDIDSIGVQPVTIKGDKGDKGDKGEKGDAGEQGIQGLQGLQGIKGDKGDKGDKGEKGDTGEQGLQGIQGIQGVAGTTPDISPITNVVSKILSVSASSNIYTLDLSQSLNFVIETTDTTAKTISFSNVPITANTVSTISIILKFTNSATFTYPSGTTWKDGSTPSYVAGKKYMLMFTTYDGGTTYLASYVGAW